MDLRSLLVIFMFACEIHSFKFEDIPQAGDRSIPENNNYLEKNYFNYLDDKCTKGDSAECFKLNALNGLDRFLDDSNYTLSETVNIVKQPFGSYRSFGDDFFEFSDAPRSSDSDWDQIQKMVLRKLESFVKSNMFEIEIPEDVLNDERYSPRFIDQISDEIDVLEDKKAPLLIKHRIKKIFIPMLLILKLFKLKLLLFLPFLLGIAGFKKLLGLAAFILPGVFAYFKLCKTNTFSPFSHFDKYSPHYSPQGLGFANTYYNNDHNAQQHTHNHYDYTQDSSYNSPYANYYRNKNIQPIESGKKVNFVDEQRSSKR